MPDITTYNARNCQVTLDGRDVRGFWEGDDAVTVERSVDRSTAMVGADGKAVVSTSADESATITLKLQHTSAAHKRLRNIEQSMSKGRTRKFPLDIADTESGEGGSSRECVIIGTPNVNTGSATASEREWKIFANPWRWNDVNYRE